MVGSENNVDNSEGRTRSEIAIATWYKGLRIKPLPYILHNTLIKERSKELSGCKAILMCLYISFSGKDCRGIVVR